MAIDDNRIALDRILRLEQDVRYLRSLKFSDVTSVTDDYTMVVLDYLIIISVASKTITLLPAADMPGKTVIIKNSSSGSVTVDGNASETIDGDTTISLSAEDAAELMSDGTNWVIV